jgi:hypothetical protein
MITWSSLQITQTQADSVFNWIATQFSSILNLIVDFRYVFIMLFFFIILVRLLKKKRQDYYWWQEINSDSRAVSWTWKKYWSTGWRYWNKWSIKNRFWFK